MRKENELTNNTGKDSFHIYEDLYHKYKKLFFNYILNFTNNCDTAEDLLQESFIKIAGKFHTLTDISKFRSWGFRIVVNTCRDWYKKIKKEKVVYTENIENFKDNLISINENSGEIMKVINRVFDTFKSDEKEIFILKQYENMNYEKIASTLNLSKRTVRRRMKSSVVKITAELERLNIVAGGKHYNSQR